MNTLDVRDGALVVEAVGEGQVLGMVGDGHVFDSRAPCAAPAISSMVFLPSVSTVCMCTSPWRSSWVMSCGRAWFCGEIDFAEIFAQLGRDVIELQLGVDFLFGFAGDRLFIFQPSQAVFVQRVAHLERALAQGDVVGFRASEVLHGGAERVRREQTDIHLHATSQAEADFIVAPGDDVHERPAI